MFCLTWGSASFLPYSIFAFLDFGERYIGIIAHGTYCNCPSELTALSGDHDERDAVDRPAAGREAKTEEAATEEDSSWGPIGPRLRSRHLHIGAPHLRHWADRLGVPQHED